MKLVWITLIALVVAALLLFGVASNRKLTINGTASVAVNGFWQFDFVRIESGSDALNPTVLVERKLLSGTAATVNGDGWKNGTSAT